MEQEDRAIAIERKFLHYFNAFDHSICEINLSTKCHKRNISNYEIHTLTENALYDFYSHPLISIGKLARSLRSFSDIRARSYSMK